MKMSLTVSCMCSQSNTTIIPYPTVVTVGLQIPPSTAAVENEVFMVCAELTSGYLERDVYVGIEAESSSAIRM